MTTRPALVPELDVTDIASSLGFYEALGFAVAYRREDEGFVFLQGPSSAQLMLQQADGPGRRFRTGALERPFGRGVNLQLEVADVEAVRDRLVAAGHQPLLDLEERWYRTGEGETGHRQFVVPDPNGYLWRPFQALE